MALKRRMPNGAPGAAGKIERVTSAQGYKGINKMQGTTRVIYDAIKLETSATSQTYNLFENCANRQYPLTNLPQNKLQVGETLAMQRFSSFIMTCTTGTTNAIGGGPFSFFPAYARLYSSTLDFVIAQDTVIKRLPFMAMQAPFNKDSRFMGYFQIQVAAADPVTSYQLNHDVFKFDNDIVIPPVIEFQANIKIPPVTVVAGFDSYLVMMISGMGSLYSPKANY